MKSAKLSEKTYATFMFLAISLLAGVLISGVAVPFVAMASSGARTAVGALEYLPAEFETPPQSQRSRILMANGEVLSTFYEENRDYVELSAISKEMQDAQVAIEDHRFREHGAIDMEGIGRAFFKTISGDTQGASTLTQQYVKLVRVEMAKASGDEEAAKAAVEVSIQRKIQEMRYAFAVEEKLSKDEILERYLNIAYYGNGAYGVEAAAQQYFGVHAKDLNLEQSAMLAGLVQNPVGLNPVKNPEKAIQRRNLVLQRMATEGFTTQEAADAAKATTFDPKKVTREPNGCQAAKYPHLCDYVYNSLVVPDTMSALGATEEERANALRRGGLTIQTLIDPKTQDAAEAAVADMVSPTDPVIGNAVLIQPSTGLIVAMAQSRPKRGDGPGETYYNYNVAGGKSRMGGAEGFQPGSTMKVFVTAAALDAGMSMNQSYNSPATIQTQGWTFKDCEGTFTFKDTKKPWAPSNLGRRDYGYIDMKAGTDNSVNTYYIQLLRDVGICASIDMAQKMGAELADGTDMRQFQRMPSWVLGTAYVTPLSMAEAYATLANRGVHCEPRIIKSITTGTGKEITLPETKCERVMSEDAADGVNHLLQSVMKNGTGRPARIPDGRPQAGKTGTSQENRSVWFAGYTPDMAGIGMLAIDSGTPKDKRPRSLTGFRLANGQRLRGTGGGDAGQIWKAAMGAALKGTPKTEFKKPSDDVRKGKMVPVPDVSGMGYEKAKQTIEKAGFQTRRVGIYSSRRSGTFLGASPSDEAPIYSTISLRVSIGPRPKPKPKPKPKVEAKPAEQKPSTAKPAETKPAEKKPAETQPAPTKPAEKPAQTQPAETKPAAPAEPAPPPAEPAPPGNSGGNNGGGNNGKGNG